LSATYVFSGLVLGSKGGGNVKNNDPSLIEPITAR